MKDALTAGDGKRKTQHCSAAIAYPLFMMRVGLPQPHCAVAIPSQLEELEVFIENRKQ